VAQTFRVIASPLGGGTMARIHLSNRFGSSPVVFTKVVMAKRIQGARIDPATSVGVTFGGQLNVTIAAGQDVISDAVAFSFAPFDDVAVSIAVDEPGMIPTHHYTARQTSYATLPDGGDHAEDADASAFTQSTTLRPFLVGIDVQTDTASAVVTFGDSITDGFQGPPNLVPQNTATIDRNERYPDFLKRRIDAAGLPFFVSNAGISGNRVREDGLTPRMGPAAITRVDPDVLAQAGVGTVIWLEGINDIGQAEGLKAEQLQASYIDVIARMHAAGLRVLQGTLTPSGSSTHLMYGEPGQVLRNEINEWIRSHSPADGVIDFDAAMRDPAHPNNVDPQYDGGDGLHFNAAGYQRMALTIDLSLLRGTPTVSAGFV
jgi:lysophospholipase L1-like esterase